MDGPIGIGKTCQEAKSNGFKRLVGSSGGNAGLAMAYASKQLDIPLTLFIPKVSLSPFLKCPFPKNVDLL